MGYRKNTFPGTDISKLTADERGMTKNVCWAELGNP